jgi:hypothetical protein
MHQKIFFSLVAVAIASTSWAQPAELKEPTTPAHAHAHAQLGLSAGFNSYTEPNLMQLKGPEIGLHLRITDWPVMPNAQFESDVLLGKQRYTSETTGNINGVANIETRWRVLTPIFGSTSAQQGFSSGLAVHTLWNDLRGTSTVNGETYGGYQRSAAQLWLPVRWASGDGLALDAGLLVYGRHTSKLSDVNRSYSDIVNTQRSGKYAQVAMQVALRNGGSLKPFVRFTQLADSDIVSMGGKYWLEPASQRWQIGAVWAFAAP